MRHDDRSVAEEAARINVAVKVEVDVEADVEGRRRGQCDAAAEQVRQVLPEPSSLKTTRCAKNLLVQLETRWPRMGQRGTITRNSRQQLLAALLLPPRPDEASVLRDHSPGRQRSSEAFWRTLVFLPGCCVGADSSRMLCWSVDRGSSGDLRSLPMCPRMLVPAVAESELVSLGRVRSTMGMRCVP